MDLDFLEKVKKWTLEAMFSDDIFIGIIVLKGGNALNLAYNISERGSIDIDFSMAGDFSEKDKERMKNQAKTLLNRVFLKEGYFAFDVKFTEKPKNMSNNVKEFWGGYKIEFKLISKELVDREGGNIDALRRKAIPLNNNNSTKFTIDISKYEYLGKVKQTDVDGTIIQVYTPEMLALEKLRAICQQHEDYKKIIGSMTEKSRARDFYDIHSILESFDIDFTTKEHVDLTSCIFKAKRVPLKLIGKIEDDREKHRQSWDAVVQTINQDEEILEFDYYFDFVIKRFSHLAN